MFRSSNWLSDWLVLYRKSLWCSLGEDLEMQRSFMPQLPRQRKSSNGSKYAASYGLYAAGAVLTDSAWHSPDPILIYNENNMKTCRAKYGIEEMCRDLWNWASKNPYGYAGSRDNGK